MSIVQLKRFTLYGMASDKRSVLDSLQELGCVHLVSLRPSERRAEMPSAQPKDTYEALRITTSMRSWRRPCGTDSGAGPYGTNSTS
jgi:V/A-type H+-transporting ATPase subunit I